MLTVTEKKIIKKKELFLICQIAPDPSSDLCPGSGLLSTMPTFNFLPWLLVPSLLSGLMSLWTDSPIMTPWFSLS